MNKIKEYELQPIYDSRKSFYYKARVKECENGVLILISYNVEVARIINKKLEIIDFYSTTTLRHIKEFVKQFTNEEFCSKKDLEKFLI